MTPVTEYHVTRQSATDKYRNGSKLERLPPAHRDVIRNQAGTSNTVRHRGQAYCRPTDWAGTCMEPPHCVQ